MPQLNSWSLAPILARLSPKDIDPAEICRLSVAIRWFLLAQRENGEVLPWKPYFKRVEGDVPYYIVIHDSVSGEDETQLRAQVEQDLKKHPHHCIPLESWIVEAITEFTLIRAQRQRPSVDVLDMKRDFTVNLIPFIDRALVKIALFADTFGAEIATLGGPSVGEETFADDCGPMTGDVEIFRAARTQAHDHIRSGQKKAACRVWCEASEEAASPYVKALMWHKALRLVNWRESLSIQENLFRFYCKCDMPLTAHHLWTRYYNPSFNRPATGSLHIDLQEQWDYIQYLCIKLRWLGIQAAIEHNPNLHAKGSILSAVLVIKLRHLLDHALFRWTRQSIGLPNGIHIAQFKFPTRLEHLRDCKALYPDPPVDQPSDWKSLATFKDIKKILEDVVAADWFKELVKLSNSSKHLQVWIPSPSQLPRSDDPENLVHLGTSDVDPFPAVPLVQLAMDELKIVLPVLACATEQHQKADELLRTAEENALEVTSDQGNMVCPMLPDLVAYSF